MHLAYLISLFIHILCAAFWIGGMLFLPLVLLPSIKNHPDRRALLTSTGVKFRFYGWCALLGLVATGVFNLYAKGYPFTMEFFFEHAVGKLFSLKLALFLIMLLVEGFHDFYIGKRAVTATNHSITKIARWSGRVNLLLALIIGLLGIVISRGGW